MYDCAHTHTHTLQTLSELLCCYICADRLRDASLCPHCSKMGCYTCIKVYTQPRVADVRGREGGEGKECLTPAACVTVCYASVCVTADGEIAELALRMVIILIPR